MPHLCLNQMHYCTWLHGNQCTWNGDETVLSFVACQDTGTHLLCGDWAKEIECGHRILYFQDIEKQVCHHGQGLWETKLLQKTCLEASLNRVQKALYQWFLNICPCNLPVSVPMVQQNGKDFTFILGIDGFMAGTGWLQRFKDHYRICLFIDHYRIIEKVVAGEGTAIDMGSFNKCI